MSIGLSNELAIGLVDERLIKTVLLPHQQSLDYGNLRRVIKTEYADYQVEEIPNDRNHEERHSPKRYHHHETSHQQKDLREPRADNVVEYH